MFPNTTARFVHSTFTLALLGVLLLSSTYRASAEAVPASSIRPERELLITSPAVTDSLAAQYPGPWSFGTLIEELVGKENAGDCLRMWLETGTRPVILNQQLVAPRPAILEKVIRPWQRRDGYDPKSELSWTPNPANAPFRLLAIVNRMDLAAPKLVGTLDDVKARWRMAGREKEFLALFDKATDNTPAIPTPVTPTPVSFGYGGGAPVNTSVDSVGEGRFVFCAIDAEGKPLEGGWTVILEYLLPRTQEGGVREWSHSWHALGMFSPSDERYAIVLEQVTRRFTHRNKVNPNTVALSQLRTSEAAFGPDREFRQFCLVGGKELAPAPLALTPGPDFWVKNTPQQRALFAFMDEQGPLIRSGLVNVPTSIEVGGKRIPLLGGNAYIPVKQPDLHWECGPKLSRDARRIFSLNTCNGCHAGETACRDGLHIHPRAEGAEARLSDFVRPSAKPLRINDPDVRGAKVEYREMADRAAIFAALLEPKDRAQLDALRDVLKERLQRTH